MSSVAILMSTYNGEKFIEEQLDSILSQKDVDVHVVVRDDGSIDNTPDILNRYASSHPNIHLILESNVGCEESFQYLTKYATTDLKCDFYAYSDQDDVWFPEKLVVSIKSLQLEDGPAMYCCNQMITDENLIPVRKMISEDEYEKVNEQLANNYFRNRHGCTMVWNRALQIILGGMAQNMAFAPGHDGWANLVARCAGKVFIGKEALMYYRIHRNNTGGLEDNIFNRIIKGFRLYLAKDCHRSEYAKDCLSLLNNRRNNYQGDNFVKLVATYRDGLISRIKLLTTKQIWQYNKADSFLYALSVLLGKY